VDVLSLILPVFLSSWMNWNSRRKDVMSLALFSSILVLSIISLVVCHFSSISASSSLSMACLSMAVSSVVGFQQNVDKWFVSFRFI
jgi:hypothetical protein